MKEKLTFDYIKKNCVAGETVFLYDDHRDDEDLDEYVFVGAFLCFSRIFLRR